MEFLFGYISLFSCFLLVVSATDCPPGALSSCTCTAFRENQLNVKCVDDFRITEIPSWLPSNTTSLTMIKCYIRTLSGHSFKNLDKLSSVEILNQRNRVTFNDSEVFQSLNNLERVFLDENNIASLPPRLFANISSLKYVSLNGNPLITLPDDLFDNSPNLELLRVGNTRLGRDVLAKIGAGHFGKNIDSLLISGTFIQHLKDGLFSGLQKLTNLAATGCRIESIGADILNGTKVTFLPLNNNQIKFINENALRDSQVSAFECSNCQLTSNVAFDGFLKKITGLYRINLRNNNLTYVPKDAFSNLKSLNIIDLSNNSISTIEENPYANLPACNDATCVQLRDNPLNCDCNLAWLRSFADKIEGNKDGWKCAQPSDVAGKSLMSLTLDEFCCVGVNATKKCASGGGSPNPGNASWGISAYIMVVIMSQIIVVMFAIPLSVFA